MKLDSEDYRKRQKLDAKSLIIRLLDKNWTGIRDLELAISKRKALICTLSTVLDMIEVAESKQSS